MRMFVLSILASLLAAITYSFLSTYLLSKRLKKQVALALSRLSGSGVEFVYSNDSEASEDMLKYVRRSKTIKMFSMRAHRLLIKERPLHFLIAPDCPVRDIKILLADPDSESMAARAQEYVCSQPNYTVDGYKRDIRWSVESVAGHATTKPWIKLRLHQEPACFRILIVDDFLFLSFFLEDTSGEESEVFRVSRLSSLYRAVNRYFDWIWEKRSTPYTAKPNGANDTETRDAVGTNGS